jgi:hypothetical protein
MNWIHDPLVTGRLLLLPFAAVQWTFMMLHTGALRRFPRNVWVRSVSASLAVILCFGVVIAQILIFSAIARIQRVTNDYVVFLILLFENLISIGLLFYGLAGGTDAKR